MKKNFNLDEILWNLSEFTGTLAYHEYKLPLKQKYLYTDGIKYLCTACECFWLLDYIISMQQHPLIKEQEFQVWNLFMIDSKWNITCQDGNKNTVFHSQIDYSDFPLNGITVWFYDSVLMLPAEY